LKIPNTLVRNSARLKFFKEIVFNSKMSGWTSSLRNVRMMGGNFRKSSHALVTTNPPSSNNVSTISTVTTVDNTNAPLPNTTTNTISNEPSTN
jgi:hypothetical protein